MQRCEGSNSCSTAVLLELFLDFCRTCQNQIDTFELISRILETTSGFYFSIINSLLHFSSLRVAVPTPRGKTGGREGKLPPVFPWGVGMATRRLVFFKRLMGSIFK